MNNNNNGSIKSINLFNTLSAITMHLINLIDKIGSRKSN